MKYVMLVGDGMADYPLAELEGKTPLMVANTPNMDWVARNGSVGLVKTIPPGFPSGTEIANMSLLGYDPVRYFTGRGPLEAASMKISLEADDVAFRCNLVSLSGFGSQVIMEDFTAGHISTEEARQIIQDIDGEMGTETIRFYPGLSYRHLMVWIGGGSRKGLESLPLVPPHDIVGKGISDYLPKVGGEDGIVELLTRSQILLKEHPVNLARMENGLKPANSIWLWGQGRRPQIPTLVEKFGIEGSVICAVDLLKGLGLYAGLKVIDVPGATGYLDTNYRGKAVYGLKELEEKDLVFIHVEAPDEAGHSGDIPKKIEAIEAFDKEVVRTILEGMREVRDYRVMVLPDHPTPIPLRTHVPDPVPFAIYDSRRKRSWPEGMSFDEDSVKGSGISIENGYQIMDILMRGD
ncbi:MAG: cofactor-independent phosphoglycerate mutase [Syntrophobacterales bacterium]|nr:MAG: cofactor-independent phosphoglycerate mutase [Syntrophobacterales bacterium]